MYGLILEGMGAYLRAEYGDETWQKIRKKAQINADNFATHQMYNDKVIQQLCQACADIIKVPADKITNAFGTYFVKFIGQYGYDTMLKVLGRHMRDFLNGLDNLHEYLKFSYPRLKAPSFRVDNENEKGLTLHYRSKRKGFLHYVKGQIVQVSELIYGTSVTIEIVHAEEMSKSCHVVMRLLFDNRALFKLMRDPSKRQKIKALDIKSDFFLDCFPFHVIFDRNMVCRHIGRSLANIMPNLLNARMESTFNLSRPVMDFTFKNINAFQNITFELTTIKDVGRKSSKGGTKTGSKMSMMSRDMDDSDSSRLKLKGQMKYIKNWDAIIFLASPVMENLDKMFDLGVYITDLSMHDVSRDLILVGAQQSRELANLLQKEQGKAKKLEEAMKKLDELRKRGDELLYSMIPSTVAARMRKGESVSDMCETHDAATMLFSDIPGFIEMTGKLKPIDVMSLLNTIFSRIDNLIERHKVYKVETVGDVYMVAAGAPEPNNDHAIQMTNLSLDMVRFLADIKDPSKDDHVKIRIGMHSGPVVTGLVGLKMPRFCFFGDTVNTAARMQTNSESMKIHISEYTKACLAGKPFKIVTRGTIAVKGKGKMNTYWLEGKSTDGSVVSPAKVKLPTLALPKHDPHPPSPSPQPVPVDAPPDHVKFVPETPPTRRRTPTPTQTPSRTARPYTPVKTPPPRAIKSPEPLAALPPVEENSRQAVGADRSPAVGKSTPKDIQVAAKSDELQVDTKPPSSGARRPSLRQRGRLSPSETSDVDIANQEEPEAGGRGQAQELQHPKTLVGQAEMRGHEPSPVSSKPAGPPPSSPAKLVSSPAKPVSTPAKPASSPAKPVSPPPAAKPVSSPTKPVDRSPPVRSVRSPAKPVSPPFKPVSSPAKPISSPAKPVSSPARRPSSSATGSTPSTTAAPQEQRRQSNARAVPSVPTSGADKPPAITPAGPPVSRPGTPIHIPPKMEELKPPTTMNGSPSVGRGSSNSVNNPLTISTETALNGISVDSKTMQNGTKTPRRTKKPRSRLCTVI